LLFNEVAELRGDSTQFRDGGDDLWYNNAFGQASDTNCIH